MLNKATKAEIKDLYDGSFASIRELAMLFNIHINVIMYFVDYKGRKKKQAEATKRWRAKNPEKAKKINDKSSKKYHSSSKGKMALHKKYLKKKKEGYFNTKEFKERIHRNYLKRKNANS